MPQQPNLLVPNASAGSAPYKPPRPPHFRLRILELCLRVMVRLYLGLIVVFLPWTHFWTENRFVLYFAPVAELAFSGVVRGLISGLGLLNIWIAIADAIHYKES